MHTITNKPADDVVRLERALKVEDDFRANLGDPSDAAVDAADAASYARGVALEERMLALRATTYEGLAVKGRRAAHYLERDCPDSPSCGSRACCATFRPLPDGGALSGLRPDPFGLLPRRRALTRRAAHFCGHSTDTDTHM